MSKLTIGMLFVSLTLFYNPVLAATPDGKTPAEEDICYGLAGAAFGLCNAYCEAMDCHSADAQASQKACDKVFDKFVQMTGLMPPCEALLPMDCVVSDWFISSFCSEPCGGGVHSLSRTILVAPTPGGDQCPPLSGVGDCNTHQCPVGDEP